MLESHDPADALSFHEALQRTLPAWLLQAQPSHLAELAYSMAQSRLYRARVQSLLSTLQALPGFVHAELKKALVPVFGQDFDPQRDQFCRVTRVAQSSLQIPPQRVSYKRVETRRSMLQAAMDNFEAEETLADTLGESYLIVGKRARAGAADFARRCRELDLGGRFQAHLEALFTPMDGPGQTQGAAAREVHEMLEEQRRFDLRVTAYLAWFQGDLTEWGFRLMQNLTAQAGPLRLKNIDIRAFVPSLMGVALREVLVIGQHPQRCNSLEQAASLFLYIPGDAQGSLKEFASVAELRDEWQQRLGLPGYADSLLRFASVQDRGRLQAQLASLQPAGSVELSISYQGTPLAANLFRDMVRAQVAALREDAARLAVPTAQVDARVRQRNWEWYETAGLDLLGVAGLLIPVLGEVMLGVAAVQLAAEVFEGFQAWHNDHRDEALEHLQRAVEQVAGAVALAAGGRVLQELAEASGFMQALQSIRLVGNQQRLWHPDLAPYRQAGLRLAEGPGEHPGLFMASGGQYLRMQKHDFAVVNQGDAWHIQPVDERHTFAPALRHNGDGGWLHAGESPWQWQQLHVLGRRLGACAEGLADEQIHQALGVCGYDLASVRQLLIEQQPLPAVIVDAFERMGGARLPWPQPVSVHGQWLLRDFPGLSVRAAEQIAASATDVELQVMNRRQRVAPALAEKAVRTLRELRLNRALIGFYHRQSAGIDTARLALGLLPRLPGWPAGESLAVTAQELVEQIDPHTDVIAALFQRLSASLQGSFAEPAELGTELASEALLQRRRCAQLLGLQNETAWLRSPQRLDAGRLGYPLSGRGRLWAIHPSRSGQVRALYPNMTDGEINQLVAYLEARGTTLASYLVQRKAELRQLESDLRYWEGEAIGEASTSARRRVSRQLRRAWGRQAERAYDPQGKAYGFRLDLHGARIGRLPELEACNFDAVVELTLTDMALSEIPQGFLAAFPDLERLSLDHNDLQRLTAEISACTNLKYLNLSHNRLSLTAEQAQALSGLTQLEELRLADNPLSTAPNLERMPYLRRLQLQSCGLQTCPEGLAGRAFLELADLRNNAIVTLPAELLAIDSRLAPRVLLGDNPFDSAARQGLLEYRQRTNVTLGGLAPRQQATWHASYYWLDLLSAPLKAQRELQWALVEHESGAGAFFDLLARLGETADYRLQRGDLECRVWALFDAAWASAGLRSELFDLAVSDVTCGDSVALNFSAMEVRMLAHQVGALALDANDSAPLLKLARGLFRLEQLDSFADQELAARPLLVDRARDQIEVRLAYRLGLADALALPGQPRTMLHDDWAGVGPQQLEQARLQVLADEQGEALQKFICSRDFWQDFLRRKYPDRFTAMQRPYRQALEAAAEEDDNYWQQAAMIGEARQNAFDALVQTLTREESTAPADAGQERQVIE
ncbi:NEL-type E3 ubiquitin ligase domain-containing protein [Pseudomonas donghuensis]|uniref:NEL-type E3 ubiquitin ligase domain-containing protein n=1 Tax=Pseudomonas donghuensis TaxID=1163398 RepID=UPI000474CBB9|nr:NEL-type E3 ubiquitin ligase domain-containing protein [Pseudomonas donghuensis]